MVDIHTTVGLLADITNLEEIIAGLAEENVKHTDVVIKLGDEEKEFTLAEFKERLGF